MSRVGRYLYNLSGVVVHSGSLTGGHYIAYVRVGNGWAYASDANVSAAQQSTVLKSQAYLLFYTSTFHDPPTTPVDAESPSEEGGVSESKTMTH